MKVQEQHWENLFADRTSEGIAWHGLWTVYSPAKEVVKSYQGVRRFWANEDKTVITHSNHYSYSDGSTQEKTWKLEKATCNHPDGIIHPAALSMRALSLGQGRMAWVSKKFEPGKPIGCELFFQQEDWRTSIAHIYGESGNLEEVTQIREHRGSLPYPTPGLEVKTIAGNWRGKKEAMSPDLKISPVEETQELVLDPTGGKNETLFLPDGVIVNICKTPKLGEDFEIVAGKFVSKQKYKRLSAKYDNYGTFKMLISEIFYLEE